MDDGGIAYWQQFGQWEHETGTAAPCAQTGTPNMNIKDLSKSKYLKTQDIPDPVVVTIVEMDLVNVAKEGERKDERPVVRFKEYDKPMVFNSTNLKRAAKAFNSDETDEWIGKKLVLYTDEDVEYAGEIVGGLRVRAMKKQQRDPDDEPDPRYKDEPRGKAMSAVHGMSDDVPFIDPYKGRLSYIV